MRGRLWTPYEDRRLCDELLAGVPVAEVAAHLGRTEPAVFSRATILRIHNLRGARPIQRPMDHLIRKNRGSANNNSNRAEDQNQMTPVEQQQQYRNLIAHVRAVVECIELLPPSREKNEVVPALNVYVGQIVETLDEDVLSPCETAT